MELITTQITILSEIFSSEVSTPHYSMGILLPQDPHPPQRALFCQKIESNEVVRSIERFDLLAVGRAMCQKITTILLPGLFRNQGQLRPLQVRIKQIQKIQKRPSTILSSVSTASLRLFYQINLLRPACLIILTTPLQPQHPPQSMQRCRKQKLQLLLVTEKL